MSLHPQKLHSCMGYDCFKLGMQDCLSDLDVGAGIFLEKVPRETFKVMVI